MNKILLKGAGLIVCPNSLRSGQYRFQHYLDTDDIRPIIHAGDEQRPFYCYPGSSKDHATYTPWGPY